MKLQFALGMAALAVLLAASPLPAQTFEIHATIPFQFTVGQKTLPAGEYTFSSPLARGVVGIWNRDLNKLYGTLAQPGYARSLNDGKVELVFHRYGQSYFLSEIRNGSGAMTYLFPEAKLEAEHRKVSGHTPGAALTILATPAR